MPIIIDAGTQMMHCPRQRAAAIQTEPLDDNQTHLLKGIKTSMEPSSTVIADPQLKLQASCSALLHDDSIEPPEGQLIPTPPSVLNPTPHFDWAEDAELLPIVSQSPLRHDMGTGKPVIMCHRYAWVFRYQTSGQVSGHMTL